MKVRRDQKRGDYADPGWYRHPPGTVAYAVKDAPAKPVRAPQAASPQGSPGDIEVTVRKPGSHSGH
jgi:hypothetical protein